MHVDEITELFSRGYVINKDSVKGVYSKNSAESFRKVIILDFDIN